MKLNRLVQMNMLVTIYRRAKRKGRNPSTIATLIERFENRRVKRNGRNPATGA